VSKTEVKGDPKAAADPKAKAEAQPKPEPKPKLEVADAAGSPHES
jgi:hypothetical protein